MKRTSEAEASKIQKEVSQKKHIKEAHMRSRDGDIEPPVAGICPHATKLYIATVILETIIGGNVLVTIGIDFCI